MNESKGSIISDEPLLIDFGPHSSVVVGPFKIQVKLDGEKILSVSTESGYIHRGIEKIAEKLTWGGFLPFLDRVDYLSAIHGGLAYAMAVESLNGLEIPPRASQIRILVSELNRIGSHLLCIALLAEKVGATTTSMYLRRDREKINNLFEMLCGARLTYSFIRIGGVAFDVTDGFVEKTNEFLRTFSQSLREYEDLLTLNKVFNGRLSQLGVISSQMALDASLTGPNLRASGVSFDLRKDAPYCGYEKYEFEVPRLGDIGDCYSRYLLRLKEMVESTKIIRQVLSRLESGPFRIDLGKDFHAKPGQAYAAVESSRGLFGVYVHSKGSIGPSRLKLRTPSFPVVGFMQKLLVGTQVSDLPTIVASLDVMASEVDR